MGLRDLDADIKPEYRTKLENIPNEFIIPLLEQGIIYKRAVGFFSSSALLEISRGIGPFIDKNGSIQLIASPKLSEEDLNAMNRGYEARHNVMRDALLRELPKRETLNLEEQDRYNLLAYLIANEYMDVKIAIVDDGDGLGIYHEKLGIVEDEYGDRVVFTGSMNESKTGMIENYGAIDVFRSWNDPEDRIPLKERAFNSIWNNTEEGISTYDFPEVKNFIKENYLVDEPNIHIDPPYAKLIIDENSDYLYGHPSVPNDSFEIRPYQNDAVDIWVENGYRGLFDMATGTGKTITALLALTRLYQDMHGDLAVIITCPYQHLVEQWVKDLKLFGIKPIIAYSKSSQPNWKQILKTAIFDRRIDPKSPQFFCCITTNATLSSAWMQKELAKLNRNVLLIADEAHNLGSSNYQKVLTENYEYRLALSATFERYRDEEGTSVLREYFGKTCIEYPLGDAINDGMLSKYKYHPIVVTLTQDELDKYRELSREIGKCITKTSSGRSSISKHGEVIAQQRARLVAGAKNKLNTLEREMGPFINESHILVYCGATQILSPDQDISDTDNEDRRQIAYVADMLGNKLGMRVSMFTADEDIKEREILKEEFRDGNLQALVAIKCLDEGVDIPNIRTAFMLASTTNPREYIQRRGRLLRLAPGKEYAEIYDFITLPYTVDVAVGQTTEELKGVYSLIKNELERGFEFAQNAMNFSEAQEVLDEIREAYRFDSLTMRLELED